MYDLARFSLRDMTECGIASRELSTESRSMEEAAQRITRYLYEYLTDADTGESACALVRFYKAHPYGELDIGCREFVKSAAKGIPISAGTKCLTLLATAGEKSDWNSRKTSVNHQAIPLPSEQIVLEFPMVSQLVYQFGLEISSVVNQDPEFMLDANQKTYNVFYVPEAIGSPYIPAQDDFVIPFGIKSILGFGGVLPSGNIFAIIMFSKIALGEEVADLFRILALSVKVAVLPFVGKAIFS